jgi:short-subunit dehydrogenase
MSMADTGFVDRYGPWALVAGASEGVGEAYARAVAERGLNVVLLARRHDVLDEVAAAIRADTGVETRAIAVDLATPDAAATILSATSDLDVGMLVYCAGADPNYEPFLANPVEVALGLVQRNCIASMQLCHHFAGPMVARGRGGIILVSSGAGLAGGANMVAYSASKAFDMVMAEALWAELHVHGVDVLGLVLSVTDTPALRRLLAKRGVIARADSDSPIPGATTAPDTVAEALANLTNGPTWFVGDSLRDSERLLRTMTRNDAVKAMLQAAGGIMGPDEPAGAKERAWQ